MNIEFAEPGKYTVQAPQGAIGFVMPPPTVGGYDLGNVQIMLTRRPHWLARWLCRLLLDWHWHEVPQ